MKCFKIFIAAFMCFAMFACVDDDNQTKPSSPSIPTIPPAVEVEVEMVSAFVEGTVKDTQGTPLASVAITSGDVVTATDVNGNFSMSRVADASGRFVLKFSKEGYFDITRSGVLEENLSMSVVMQPKSGENTLTTTFEADAEETLEADGMRVDIPALSLVTLDGSSYSGTVQAEMLYLSPDNDNFTEMMPGGDLAAVRTDDSEATLISYGMVEVSLSDGQGNSLQLKEGEKSQMTFPIPESMRDNPPATIPLWYFDENAGLWIEEGEATLDGDVYVGYVNHFSWHNLDVPAERVTISGKITDCMDRPVSRVLVTVEQTNAMTRSDGTYTVYVPENTPVKVVVEGEDYYNYSPEVSVDVAGQPGGTTVRNVDLVLPCLPVISGRIINAAGSLVVARVYCEYTINGVTELSDVAYTNASTGEFSFRISPEAAGPATLVVEPVGGVAATREIYLDGEDITVNVEINQTISEDSDNIITITNANDEVLVALALDAENAIVALAQGAFMVQAGVLMCDEGSFTAVSEAYDGTSSSIDDVQMILYAVSNSTDIYAFTCETGHVDIIERTDTEVTLMFTADGVCLDSSGNEQQVTLIGTLKAKIGVSIEDTNKNVTDWSSLQCADVVPQLKVPIDLVANISVMGIEVEALFYNGTMSDVEAMQNILANNGWSVVSEDKTETTLSVVYMNSDGAMVSIEYDAAGIETIDGNTYTIIVVPLV